MTTERIVSCSEAVRQLWAYLDRTLPAADRADVDAHLARCRTCCGELEFARELQGFIASHASDDVPDDVRRRLERFVSEL
jgi:mycothiol system anti-sigma-R factor